MLSCIKITTMVSLSLVAEYIKRPELVTLPLAVKLQIALNELSHDLPNPRHYFRLESSAAEILRDNLNEIEDQDSLKIAFTSLVNRPKCIKVLLTHPNISEEIIQNALADLAVSSSNQVAESFSLLIKNTSNPDYSSLLYEAINGHNPAANRDRRTFIKLCLKRMGKKISALPPANTPEFINYVETIIKTLKPLPDQQKLSNFIKESTKQITTNVSQRVPRGSGQIEQMVDDIMDAKLTKGTTLSNLCRTKSEREVMQKELTKFLTKEGARKFCLSDKTKKNLASVAKYSALVSGIAVASAVIGVSSGVLAVPTALVGSSLVLAGGFSSAKTISAICAIAVPAVVGIISLDKRARYDIESSAKSIAQAVISHSTEIKPPSPAYSTLTCLLLLSILDLPGL